MPVTELYAFNLICENLLAALYGVALNIAHMGNNVKIPLKNRLFAANLNGLKAVIRRCTLDNFFRMGIIYLYIK